MMAHNVEFSSEAKRFRATDQLITYQRKTYPLLRAGMLPMAYVYPKQMRSTRDLLRPYVTGALVDSPVAASCLSSNSERLF